MINKQQVWNMVMIWQAIERCFLSDAQASQSLLRMKNGLIAKEAGAGI